MKKLMLLCLFIILLLLLFAQCDYESSDSTYDELSQLEDRIDELESQVFHLQNELEEMRNQLEGVEKKTAINKKESKSDSNTIVYITKSGKKYHQSWCTYLRKSRIAISLKDAKSRGYSPCSRCKPPR